jgi:hypothetical protein
VRLGWFDALLEPLGQLEEHAPSAHDRSVSGTEVLLVTAADRSVLVLLDRDILQADPGDAGEVPLFLEVQITEVVV